MKSHVNARPRERVLVFVERVAGDIGIDEVERPAGLAFEGFFEAQHAGLFGALRLMTRDAAEAEDVMQEAFTRVFERWDRVAAMDDPVGYLYRSAFNVFRSRRRRAGVAVRRGLQHATDQDRITQAEQRLAILQAMRALTPRQRAAIVATEVLGYSSEEAARLLGVRASTVRVLAARARAVIKNEIGERP